MTFRSLELLRLARLAPTCMHPDCRMANDGSVVAAHRNEDKAMGSKNSDAQVAFLCWRCHALLDQGAAMTKEDRRAFWMRAFWASLDWLWESGHIQVAPNAVEPPHARSGTATRPIKKKVPKGRPIQNGAGFPKSPKRPIPSRPLRS